MYLATKPPKPAQHLADAAMVGGDDLAQILGVEPGRQLGRADEVAEHDRQLAALGSRDGRRRGGGLGRRAAAHRGDRGEQPAAVADRGDAETDQVLGRQRGQDVGVDVVVAECGLILPKAEPAQPLRDIGSHARAPSSRRPAAR